jgi:heat-inducible transcriptional repressor
MPLTERQEQILKTIVERYITTAHPVGSSAVLTESDLAVSSATVRNEMAALEEMGYIRHLHTSGGRVPTNDGYRYYVERLMTPGHVTGSEARTIQHQFQQSHSELQEWLQLAASILARRIHNVGLITAPKSAEVRLRHLELISIQPGVALVLVVLHDGTVLQEMVTLLEPRTQEELGPMGDRLTADLRGLTARQVEARVSQYGPAEAGFVTMVAHLLSRGEARQTQLIHAGLADMIQQPEFLGPRPGESLALVNERLRHMVDFLQHGVAVQRLLASLPEEGDVQIVIGGETIAQDLMDYSFVLGRYGGREERSGYLGVVGPTRMEYPRAVAIVRYMTHLMTSLTGSYD